MRIRSTKPEFWRSKTIARFDWGTRLVLKGLESYVDDNGVGKDDIPLIAADVFPRDLSGSPHETLMQITEAISRLAEAGLVVRYTMDGEDLLYIDRWKDWQYIQHPKAGRFRRPDGTLDYTEDVNPDSYRKPPADCMKPPENCMTGTGEQGNRGTEEPPYPPHAETAPLEPLHTPTKNGAEIARNRFANIPSRSLNAHRIAEAFSASMPVPVERDTLNEIGIQIDKCLKSDIPPAAIAAGLKAWNASDSWSPTQIPKFVTKANSRTPTNGKPTAKATTHQQALEELLTEVTTL
jgi:hypothetical protein